MDLRKLLNIKLLTLGHQMILIHINFAILVAEPPSSCRSYVFALAYSLASWLVNLNACLPLSQSVSLSVWLSVWLPLYLSVFLYLSVSLLPVFLKRKPGSLRSCDFSCSWENEKWQIKVKVTEKWQGQIFLKVHTSLILSENGPKWFKNKILDIFLEKFHFCRSDVKVLMFC